MNTIITISVLASFLACTALAYYLMSRCPEIPESDHEQDHQVRPEFPSKSSDKTEGNDTEIASKTIDPRKNLKAKALPRDILDVI